MILSNLLKADSMEYDENIKCEYCNSKNFEYNELVITLSYYRMNFHCNNCDRNFNELVTMEVKEIMIPKKILKISREKVDTDHLPGFMY